MKYVILSNWLVYMRLGTALTLVGLRQSGHRQDIMVNSLNLSDVTNFLVWVHSGETICRFQHL